MKLERDVEDKGSTLSHPTWVRGLKLQFLVLILAKPGVAPYVGAWIET